MPPTRTMDRSLAYRSTRGMAKPLCNKGNNSGVAIVVATGKEVVDLARCKLDYPTGTAARQSFRTKTGKSVTPHQWAVYDFVRNIPAGKVTTYKDICISLGQGSPRSVGGALRTNPFAPFVPCHRIIASNYYIGGFFGEWRPNAGTRTQNSRKREMLAKEGVGFDGKGYLLERESRIWRG